jgi:hypothetical protein
MEQSAALHSRHLPEAGTRIFRHDEYAEVKALALVPGGDAAAGP